MFRVNWLHVFQRVNTAYLPHSGGQARETTFIPSEKCVAHSGSEDDKMRMIPARFVRVLRWIPRHLITHHLLIFQEMMSISKTCNQFSVCGGNTMLPDPLFSRRLLVGLGWLCLMLHVVGPPDRATTGPITPRPAKAPPTCSSDLTPFPGLTRTPPWAACEQAHGHGSQLPGCPPPHIVPTRGRPRQGDTSSHFCPHPPCAYWGWVGLGNISANGHPNGGPWRQLPCTACESYFLATHGTPLPGKRVSMELLGWAVGALAEGLGIRAVARVFEVDPPTVLQWLVEAADHL